MRSVDSRLRQEDVLENQGASLISGAAVTMRVAGERPITFSPQGRQIMGQEMGAVVSPISGVIGSSPTAVILTGDLEGQKSQLSSKKKKKKIKPKGSISSNSR